MTLTDTVVWVVALPLAGALAGVVWPRRVVAIGVLTALATSAAVLALLWRVAAAGTWELALGGWPSGLGIALRADALSALFLALTAAVGLGLSLQASTYFRSPRARRDFWPLWLLLWAALNALLLSADLFNLYVTLELLGLAAVALTALGGGREALTAALRYLLLGLLASLAFLAGVALIYTAYGRLDLAGLAGLIAPGPAAGVAVALMSAGLLLKSALFPLHFWLPPAHAAAPAPVSAALSALVVKAAFYLLLRLWLGPFAGVVTPASAALLGMLGAAAVLAGSWQALRAERLKLMAAHSTVAQLGYLFVFLPPLALLAPGPARDALFGGLVVLALTHGLAKAALFLAAGVVQQRAGHDRIRDLGGTAQALPVTVFALAVAGVALIGLPPSGTFLAKWQLIDVALRSGLWPVVLVVMAGTLLASAYVFRVLGHAFDHHSHHPTPGRAPPALREELPALILALAASLGLGLAGAPVWRLLEGAT